MLKAETHREFKHYLNGFDEGTHNVLRALMTVVEHAPHFTSEVVKSLYADSSRRLADGPRE